MRINVFRAFITKDSESFWMCNECLTFVMVTVYVFCEAGSLLYVYVSSSCQLALFGYSDWSFSVLFPQVWGKCQGKTRKEGARPALFVFFYVLFVLCCSVYCLCVCKCVFYCCHRVATQLQLTNIWHIVSYHIISYHIISCHIQPRGLVVRISDY